MCDFIISHYDLVRRCCWLLFYPKALVHETVKRDKISKNQADDAVEKLRKKVFRGFGFVVYGIFLAVVTYLLLAQLGFHLGHRWHIFLRLTGYAFVLWGVLSPVGYKIRTFDGETLPEVVDEEWHRALYFLGVISLFLSYLAEW